MRLQKWFKGGDYHSEMAASASLDFAILRKRDRELTWRCNFSSLPYADLFCSLPVYLRPSAIAPSILKIGLSLETSC